jgi:hypothetical protein
MGALTLYLDFINLLVSLLRSPVGSEATVAVGLGASENRRRRGDHDEIPLKAFDPCIALRRS